MSDLVEWVSDSLHSLLGLSDRYTAEFLVGLAKKANSSEAFLRKLKDTGAITINDKVSSFASELWMKTPHQRVDRYQASREKEKAAVLQRQKNKSYQLLLDEDDEPEKASRSSKKPAKRRKEREKEEREEREQGSRKRRNIRTEKASAVWESDSEEEGRGRGAKRTRADSDSDEWEK